MTARQTALPTLAEEVHAVIALSRTYTPRD
jgi:hypothetical protein